MKNEKNFLIKISDKSAIEDYKNLKTDISEFNMKLSPRKLACQKIRSQYNETRDRR